MVDYFYHGGIIQWVLLLITVFILIQVLTALFNKEKNTDKIQKKANSILFWGCISFLISIAYFLISFYRFGTSLTDAKEVSLQITFMGLADGVAPILSSVFILLFSLTFWYITSKVYKK
jgi:hypothetical protein